MANSRRGHQNTHVFQNNKEGGSAQACFQEALLLSRLSLPGLPFPDLPEPFLFVLIPSFHSVRTGGLSRPSAKRFMHLANFFTQIISLLSIIKTELASAGNIIGNQ